jgi:hypothetical protein
MPRRTRATYQPPISTFRVRILGGGYAPPEAREVWREIEVAANQTLADLGEAIPLAFGFDDPHLWSFFLSGKAWDQESEWTLDLDLDLGGGDGGRPASEILIRDVPYPGKTGKQEFLFLFDYGDEWHFGVKLRGTRAAVEPGVAYPRVAASHGEAPPQYPDFDDEEEWDDEEAEEDEEGP